MLPHSSFTIEIGMKFTRIVLVIIFVINLFHHSNFLAASLDFNTVFTLANLKRAIYIHLF